ncbi:MAG: 4Fe-4S dicluster domain-containing protein [Promethearchaeota archaeon]
MNQMGFYFDQTRCIGCYTCSIACKDWNDSPVDVNWRQIKIIEDGTFPKLFLAYLSTSCHHCADPPCVKACPTRAIIKRQSDGIVVVNSEECLGKKDCSSRCLKVCPWDIPQFRSEENSKMEKCNFCLERLEKGQQPICVEACPMYALDAGPIDELREKYGNNSKAEGFKYSENLRPSIIFKSKSKKSE